MVFNFSFSNKMMVIGSFRSQVSRFDWPLIVASALLIVIGLSTIASTIIAGEGLTADLLNRQVLAVMLGGVVFLVVSLLNYRDLFFISPLLYLFTLVILGLVLVVGLKVRGATRWFIIGDLYLQPSELAKPLLIIIFAAFFSYLDERINSLKFLLLSVVLFGIPLGLIFFEPDLGTVVILFATWFVMLFFSPIKTKYFILYLLTFILTIPFFWFLLADYQQVRLLSFLDPMSDPLGAGYNLIQSIIAVGSGQLMGRGWGRGTQSHLKFLPEQHTDFVFATLSEELGFVGVLVVFILFGTLFWRGLVITQQATDLFGSQLAVGITALLFVQVFINVGMNLGLLPVTGVPLPLVSYGGSSLVGILISLGILQSIAVNRRI